LDNSCSDRGVCKEKAESEKRFRFYVQAESEKRFRFYVLYLKTTKFLLR